MNITQLKLRSAKFDDDDDDDDNNNNKYIQGQCIINGGGGYYYPEISQAVSICPSGKG